MWLFTLLPCGGLSCGQVVGCGVVAMESVYGGTTVCVLNRCVIGCVGCRGDGSCVESSVCGIGPTWLWCPVLVVALRGGACPFLLETVGSRSAWRLVNGCVRLSVLRPVSVRAVVVEGVFMRRGSWRASVRGVRWRTSLMVRLLRDCRGGIRVGMACDGTWSMSCAGFRWVP